MVTEIKKNTPSEEVRKILRKSRRKKSKKAASLSSFFGKLPGIGDGLAYQKKIRNEWK